MQRTVRNGHLFMLLLPVVICIWSGTSSVGKKFFMAEFSSKQKYEALIMPYVYN
jgi:hypothetical protein